MATIIISQNQCKILLYFKKVQNNKYLRIFFFIKIGFFLLDSILLDAFRLIIILIFGQHLIKSFTVLELFLLSLAAPGYNPLGMRPVQQCGLFPKERGEVDLLAHL